jgi:hypothetical protein
LKGKDPKEKFRSCTIKANLLGVIDPEKIVDLALFIT